MNQKGFINIILVVVIVVVAGTAGVIIWKNKKNSPTTQNTPTSQPAKTTASPSESLIEAQIRTAVERVLLQGKPLNPNEQMPVGVKLLSVDVNENKVTLNFSKQIASRGQGVFEDVLTLVSNAIHPIIQGEGSDGKYAEFDLDVFIEGKTAAEVF